MNPLLHRQLDNLGLTAATPPSAADWARLLQAVERTYTQADESHALTERTAAQSSAEMRALNDQLRNLNAGLEARVNTRSAELISASTRLEFALRNANACTWEYDVEADEVILSDNWAAMLGRPPGITVTRFSELMRLVPPEELERATPHLIAALKGQREDYVLEHRVRTEVGDLKWVLSHGQIVERHPATGKASIMIQKLRYI